MREALGLAGGGGRNRLGSASPGRCPGQGRANDLGAVLRLRERKLRRPPRGASRGRWVCVHGDFVTPGTTALPTALTGALCGPGSAISFFLNRSHLHTTFSFIKTRRSWGRAGRARHRVGAPGSAQRPERGSSLPSAGARECVHARVGRHTRPTVSGQLWGRIRSVCSEGGRACGEARSWHVCEVERVPVRAPSPQARGEQSSQCLVRGAYARPSGRPELVTVSRPSGSCFPP